MTPEPSPEEKGRSFFSEPPPRRQEESPKPSFLSPSDDDKKGLAKGFLVIATWFFFGWVYALGWVLGFGTRALWRERAKARLTARVRRRAAGGSRPLSYSAPKLLFLALLSLVILIGTLDLIRSSVGRLPSSTSTTAPPKPTPGFFFSVGDNLVNVNNGVEIGVVVRTEMAHTFRNGTVGRAYIITRPNGAEMDMVAEVLERIAAKR